MKITKTELKALVEEAVKESLVEENKVTDFLSSIEDKIGEKLLDVDDEMWKLSNSDKTAYAKIKQILKSADKKSIPLKLLSSVLIKIDKIGAKFLD